MSNFIDISGQVINRVRVLHLDFSKSNQKNKYWTCVCPCGNEFSARAYELRTKAMKCSDCKQKEKEKRNEEIRKDMTGQVIDYLKVRCMDQNPPDKLSGTYWICDCKCGNTVSLRGVELRRGGRKSCGCKRMESASKGHVRTHGASNEPWYSNWRMMVYRTTNPKSSSFERYEKVVEEGEKIDQEFIKDPWAFFKEIGEKPGPEYSIDRINNSKGYVKGNIQWSTAQAQYFNRNIIKRSDAENEILELAKKAKTKEELIQLFSDELDPELIRNVSLV